MNTLQSPSGTIKPNQEMDTITLCPIKDTPKDQQIAPITILSSEEILTKRVWLKNICGFKRVVKLKRLVALGITTIVIDDNYARHYGYKNREDMIHKGKYDDSNGKHELLHHPEADVVYALLKRQKS